MSVRAALRRALHAGAVPRAADGVCLGCASHLSERTSPKTQGRCLRVVDLSGNKGTSARQHSIFSQRDKAKAPHAL